MDQHLLAEKLTSLYCTVVLTVKTKIMNKKFNLNPFKGLKTIRYYLLTIMRIFLLLITLGLSSVFADSSYSQTKISIDVNNISFVELFKEIQNKSEFVFFYKSSILNKKDKITLRFNKATLATILNQAFLKTNLNYSIDDRQVVIVENSKKLLEKSMTIEQQEKEIKGTIVDENGVPLPGAAILIKGTSKGTQTDFDGNFTIEMPSEANILVVSYIGFKTQEVNVEGKTEIQITMITDAAGLDEIVIVGYGTLSKKLVTGSVSSISAKTISSIPVTSAENAILGQVAGVQVQEVSGEPGSGPVIRIRGTASISAGSEPLYVIDGIPISKNIASSAVIQGNPARTRTAFQPPPINPLASINPNDIESISILKDASASAIYGSRGGNGVIIITTKKGSGSDKGVFSFDSFFSAQTVANKIDLMNAEELIAYTTDARNNNYLSSVPGASITDPIGPGQRGDTAFELPESFINWDGTDTDWQDEIFETGFVQSYNLSYASPLQNKTSYFVSGNYYSQEGIIPETQFERYSLRLNLNSQLTEKLNLDIRVSPAITENDRKPANSPYFARPPGIVYSGLVHSPTVKPFNDDGTINQRNNQSHLGGGTTTASNPLAIIDAIDNKLFQFQTQASVGLSYKITPELTFKTFGGSYVNIFNNDFFRDNSLLFRNATQGESYAQATSSTELNWLWENTLNWEKEIGDHYINVLLGYTAQKDILTAKSVQANNFPDDLVNTISGGQVFAGNSIKEKWSLASALFRVNYNYKGKYLFTGSFRSDTSSRFGKNNRTGYFPSFSVGWRVNEEDFMSDIEVISELKLRLSWGETGNFEIPNFGAIGLLSPDNFNLNGNEVNGLIPSTIANDDLTWEKSDQLNFGLELGLFNNRVFLLADYYRTETSDLLLNVGVSSVSGFQTALQNIGRVENKGFEIALKTRNLVGDFKWETDFNFSKNDNEVLALGANNEPIFSQGGAGIRHVTRVGDAIGSYFGYVVDGIYQNQADIDNSPSDTQAPNPAPGDFKFKDVNGDGKITPDDRTVIGSYFPDYTWGINNTFSYKNFDLSILFQGIEGNEILNLTSRHLKNGEANFNSYAVFNNRWRSESEPGNGKIPRADRQTGNHGNNNRPSSFQVEDASYLRLRNLTIGYSFPLKENSQFNMLRLYVTGTNLFTETDYLGFNPEVNNQATSGLTPGEDYGSFPLAKSFTFGFNVIF